MTMQPVLSWRRRLAGLSCLLTLGAFGPLFVQDSQAQPREVRVYSGRHYNSDRAIYDQFTKATGIRVRLVESKDTAILQRIRTEGINSPADVVILVDAARLDQAAREGVFQPARSAQLLRDVPLTYRDPKGRWFGLTRRVRSFVVNPKLVNPSSLRTYADLANPRLKGKVCLRERNNVYNQSLVADQLVLRGEKATAAWIRGMVANMEGEVFTGDIALARAVADGECGVGLVNSYYVARMLAGQNGAADRALAQKVRIVYPNPAHVNVSGGGVTRNAGNAAEAVKLLEFLASPTGGEGYASGSNEYPLKGYGNNPILKRFGTFKPDGVSAELLGSKTRQAIRLMEVNGWE